MAKKKMDYDEVARNIIANIGGKENVNGLRHCITRVRFRLKDESLANDDVLNNTDGVISIVKGGGEYMVVIGNEVENVYNAVCDQLGMAGGEAVQEEGEKEETKNPVMRVLNVIVQAFLPSIDFICAGGVIKGILAILTMVGMSDSSGLYMVLNAIGDAPFFFLPVIVGYNLAKSQGVDGVLGLVIGGVLCYPAINGVDISIFGRTLNVTYTSSFLPAIVITAIAVPILKWLRKHLPGAIRGFGSYVLTLLIVMPIGYAFIGPAANAVGEGLNVVITALMNTVPVIAGAVFGGLYQVLVLFGIHSALTTFAFVNLMNGNPDAIMAIGCCCCFAQIGVVLAIILRTKDEKLKSVAMPAFFSGIFGVTEPAIYGVTLPRIKMFVISCIGGAIAGIYIMLTGLWMQRFTGLGVFTLLGLLSPENPNVLGVVLCAVIPFAASFAMAFAMYREDEGKAQETGDTVVVAEPAVKTTLIDAPIPGKVVPIESVPDETFAAGLLGTGFAIEPSEGKVYAPFDGTCETVFDTLHALGLQSDSGVSLLIHVGLETVNLGGKPFRAHIKSGERIKKGQLLLEFNIDEIREAGCETVVPVLVTNVDDFSSVTVENETIKAEV